MLAYVSGCRFLFSQFVIFLYYKLRIRYILEKHEKMVRHYVA